MRKIFPVIWLFSAWACAVSAPAETKVSTEPTPFGGRRARTATDAHGNVHLIFNREGNLFYSRKEAQANEFSPPIRVNTIDRSPAAADIALGADGRVHVVYHGNIFFVREQIKAESRRVQARDIKYTFYSRLNPSGDGFEAQLDLSGGVWGFDGGCAIAADSRGNVYLFFNGMTSGGGEQGRRVFLSRSQDNGETFSDPTAIDLRKGVCACCHLSATMNDQGHLSLAYRVAENGVNRDSYVLTSCDQGKTFQPAGLDHWELRACPGSLYSFAQKGPATLVSWRTKEEIYFAEVGSKEFLSPPGRIASRRAAILASNHKGETLIAWSEGGNFNQPHDLRWQLYNQTGKPNGDMGVKSGAFERWGNSAIFTDASGNFVVLH